MAVGCFTAPDYAWFRLANKLITHTLCVAWTLVVDSVATWSRLKPLACTDPTFGIAVMGDKL